jgi:hypothetical protein
LNEVVRQRALDMARANWKARSSANLSVKPGP